MNERVTSQTLISNGYKIYRSTRDYIYVEFLFWGPDGAEECVSRVCFPTTTAKSLTKALHRLIEEYEAEFGKIPDVEPEEIEEPKIVEYRGPEFR
jgi:endonuclease III